MKLHKEIPILIGLNDQYTLRFNGPLQTETLSSTYFNTTITGQSYEVYITDLHDTTVGDIGTLVMKRVSDDVIVSSNIGSIDYTTGVVNISSLTIDSLSGNQQDLRIYVEPFGDAPNILTSDLTTTTESSTTAVFPYAARNTVLTLDTSAAESASNILPGLSITAVSNSQE